MEIDAYGCKKILVYRDSGISPNEGGHFEGPHEQERDTDRDWGL